MKKIASYCVVALTAIPICVSATPASDLRQDTFSVNAELGCLNPNYPIIEKQFWPTQASALKIDIQSNGVVLLQNNVKIPIEGGALRAKSASYNNSNQSAQKINAGSLYYLGSYFQFQSGSLNNQSKNFSFIDCESYLSERNLLIEYGSLAGKFGSELRFQDARLTSCLDSTSGWLISAKTVVINESSQRGHIQDLSLHVWNKKVLKLPYLPFTTASKRLSGFLEPDIGVTSDGLDLYIPYFLVLSSKSDVTIAPRLLRDRGTGLEANYRYLTHDSSINYLNFIYFTGDKKAKRDYAVDDSRWAFKLKDVRRWQNIHGEVEWAKSSDPMVLLDLPSSLINIANQRDEYLPQTIKVKAVFDKVSLSLARQGYQPLNPFLSEGYIKKPEVELAYQSFKGPVSYFSKILYTDFGVNRKVYNGFAPLPDMVTGSRSIAQIGASSRHQVGVLNIALNSSVTTKKYSLNNLSKSPNLHTIPSFNVTFSGTARRKISQGVSLITPSLSYARTSYRDQSLDPVFDLHVRGWHYLAFDSQGMFFGKDRVADQEHFVVKINWDARLKNQHQVLVQVLRKHELEASKVLNEMLKLNLQPDKQSGVKIKWGSLKANALLEANYSDKRNQLNFMNAHYKMQLQDTEISVSRKFRRQVPLLGRINELDYGELTIEQRLSGGYKFLAGISKDLSTSKNLASYLGVGYENCCIALKLFASDKRLSKYQFSELSPSESGIEAWEQMISVENKSRINFEFELKGITSSRTQLNKFFSNTFANF